MSDRPTWKIARLDEMHQRDSDLPIREQLGIHAFGFGIRTPEGGILVNEHDEASTGQEELYVVLDGDVRFEIDGDTVEAAPGTLLSVAPESRRKAIGEGTILVIGGKPGEAYPGIDWGDAWPLHRDSIAAYGEQRYGDALHAVRQALEQNPDHPGLHYNYACFATLAGDTGDETFNHLRRSVELRPEFRESARTDDDLATIRDDPRFAQALK
jgi:hypothetical protein